MTNIYTNNRAEILNKLKIEVERCQRCSLYKTRTKIVFGAGPATTKIMFISEAPGYCEDVKGEPFVGPAGKVLDELLTLAGLNRGEAYMANVLKCRPVIGKRNRPPKRTEIEACKPFLERQINLIKPKLIVTLGNCGLQTVLNKNLTITKVHGKILKKDNMIIFPTFHPAAALRFPKIRKLMEEDMKTLKDLILRF